MVKGTKMLFNLRILYKCPTACAAIPHYLFPRQLPCCCGSTYGNRLGCHRSNVDECEQDTGGARGGGGWNGRGCTCALSAVTNESNQFDALHVLAESIGNGLHWSSRGLC
jgi:hypothetical protein